MIAEMTTDYVILGTPNTKGEEPRAFRCQVGEKVIGIKRSGEVVVGIVQKIIVDSNDSVFYALEGIGSEWHQLLVSETTKPYNENDMGLVSEATQAVTETRALIQKLKTQVTALNSGIKDILREQP